MKRILAALLLLPMLAFGAPYDLVIQQRNATDTGLSPNRFVSEPPGGANGVMAYSATTRQPLHLAIGSGLSMSGTSLVALPQAWADITGKPALAAVATSGSYTDLTGKPALFSGAYSSLTGIPTTFAPAAHTQAWSTITATPTTLAGYGITDGATTAQLATKFTTPAGTVTQYVRGDGSLATLPVAKRIEVYSGTTNASGQITVTYPSSFPAVPVVQPPAPAAANQVWTTVSSTATGFTLQLNQRNTVTLLGIEVLLGATVPVTGTASTILVVAQ